MSGKRTVAVWERPAASHLVDQWSEEQRGRISSFTILKGGDGSARVELPDGEVLFLLPAVDGFIPKRDAAAVIGEVVRDGGVDKLLCFGRVPVLCPNWSRLTDSASGAAVLARGAAGEELDPDVAATLQRGAFPAASAAALPAPKNVPTEQLWCGHDGPPAWDGRTWVCAVCERTYVIEPGPAAAERPLLPPARLPAHLGTTET